MDPLLSRLLAVIDSNPRPVDKNQVIKAYDFAVLAHTGQTRDSGEPFVIHPVQVAQTLAAWNTDTTTVVAGLLHDTVENGGAKPGDIQKEFGPDIWRLVDGVTIVTNIRLTGNKDEYFVENLRKMLLVMARDLRVVLIKLADRLHNMQTLEYLAPDRQTVNARETLEIYAPLAERLGMGEIKGQLEDLAFPYLYPKEHKLLVSRTGKLFQASDKYIEKFRRELLALLMPKLPDAVVSLRHKHLYSLWTKLNRPEISGDLSKVHDLVAARVLVDTVEQCYIAMGLIHNKYHPVPYLGLRDYIANPKPNGYSSLHLNVFGPEGRIVELQIRTHTMNEQAEMGVAAHWQMSQLKSAGKLTSKDIDQGRFQTSNKLAWVKQLVAWQNQVTDDEEYLQGLKFDALAHRNLVFSPKGDVYDLPLGATPVDFAYAVHTGLGHQAAGAKVNSKQVALNHILDNGDVVEIIVDRKRTQPSHDWLDFVVTTTARREIQKSLKN